MLDGLSHKCKSCVSSYNKEKKQQYKVVKDAYYQNNREKILQNRKDRYDPKKKQAYYIKNKGKIREGQRKALKEHYKNNKAWYYEKAALRRANKNLATPDWLSDAQRAHIKRTYKLREIISEATGTLYHVDHIVPLKGENVCGLHVPWNLQVIPAKENLSKGNKVLL